MFTVSVKITKRQVLAAAAAFVLAFAGGIWAKAALSELRGSPAQSDAVVKIDKAPARTNEQRVALLEAFGWQVDGEAVEIIEVLIPQEFDEVITNYNTLQKGQGCNLEKYAGKRCKRYSYIIENYPGSKENIRANMLVYNGKLIGGDICSTEMGGFMHGFAIGKEAPQSAVSNDSSSETASQKPAGT